MGDTNSRYTRAADTIADFVAGNGLTDAWVRTQRGGVPPARGSDPLLCDENAATDTCEVVDKVLYRSSPFVTLTALGYHNQHAGFLDAGVIRRRPPGDAGSRAPTTPRGGPRQRPADQPSR